MIQYLYVHEMTPQCVQLPYIVTLFFFFLVMRTCKICDSASGEEPGCECRRHKMQVQSLRLGEGPLEEEMVTHSSTLAWRIRWTEESGRLQSMGPQRVRHY